MMLLGLLLVTMTMTLWYPIIVPVYSDAFTDGLWLIALYNVTNGSGWNSQCTTNWNINNPATVCTSGWAKVSCNSSGVTGVVNYVTLNGCNLQGGPLPEVEPPLVGHVGTAMAFCRVVQLAGNSLSGSMPASWSSMSSLSTLQMYASSLSGSLPPSWSSLSSLRFVDLWLNSLTGSMPPSWKSMTSMSYLWLNGNSFSGSLPSSWSSMISLNNLRLSQNSLTGSLPSSWYTLYNMGALWLSSNRLTGTLPSSWYRMSLSASFDDNYFIGDVPSSWLWSNATLRGSFSTNCLNVTNPAAVSATGRITGVVDAPRNVSICLRFLHSPTMSRSIRETESVSPSLHTSLSNSVFEETMTLPVVLRPTPTNTDSVTTTATTLTSSLISSTMRMVSSSSSFIVSPSASHVFVVPHSKPTSSSSSSFPVATQSIALVAAIAGVSSGFTVQRAGLSLRLLVCDFSVDDAPDIPTSPTQLSLGSDEQRYQRGTVIGNICILLGIAAACTLLSALRKWFLRWRDGVEITVWRGAASLHLPGWMVVFWSFLLQPLVSAIVCLLMLPVGGAGDVAIGLIALLVIAVVLGMEVRMLVFCFHASRDVHQRRYHNVVKAASTTHSSSMLSRLRELVVRAKDDDEIPWRDKRASSDDANKNSSRLFVKHYGAVFAPFRQGAHVFPLVDSLFAVVCSLLQAVGTVYSSAGCSTELYALCALQVLYFLVIVVWRPHEATSEWIAACMIASFGAAFGGLVLVPFCDTCDSIAAGLAQGQVYFTFLDLCVQMIQLLRSGRFKRFIDRLLRIHRNGESSASSTEMENEGVAADRKNGNAEVVVDILSFVHTPLPPPPRVPGDHHASSQCAYVRGGERNGELRMTVKATSLVALLDMIETICSTTTSSSSSR